MTEGVFLVPIYIACVILMAARLWYLCDRKQKHYQLRSSEVFVHQIRSALAFVLLVLSALGLVKHALPNSTNLFGRPLGDIYGVYKCGFMYICDVDLLFCYASMRYITSLFFPLRSLQRVSPGRSRRYLSGVCGLAVSDRDHMRRDQRIRNGRVNMPSTHRIHSGYAHKYAIKHVRDSIH